MKLLSYKSEVIQCHFVTSLEAIFEQQKKINGFKKSHKDQGNKKWIYHRKKETIDLPNGTLECVRYFIVSVNGPIRSNLIV